MGFLFSIVAWIYVLIHFQDMKSESWCVTGGSILASTGIAMLKLGQA